MVYEHKEYPKWVTNLKGERLIVQNAAEEAEVTGSNKEEEKPKPKAKKTEWK